MIADPREIQRLRFQPGQDLLSRDFRDGAAFDLSLREWHNRALHQAFGVASGLLTVPIPGPNATAVEVSPGLAYDSTGRALFVPRTTVVPVPNPWPGDPHLLVLRAGPLREVSGDLAGVCLNPSAALGDELAWIPEAQWRPGSSVPLARIRGDKATPWDPEFRPPIARPLARQRIASGTTLEGATAWQSWFPQSDLGLRGIEVQVNTSAGEFSRIPCYFAWVQGALLVERPGGDVELPALHLPLFSHITEASITGFRFRVAAAFNASCEGIQPFPPFEILLPARRSLSVCWLGIETNEMLKPEPIPG